MKPVEKESGQGQAADQQPAITQEEAEKAAKEGDPDPGEPAKDKAPNKE